jgi:hypothetical protein
METEEIIQNKEWNELNESERKQLHSLADNEQEYTLLKKMLQVSAEEMDDVPVLSPQVHTDLKVAIARERKKPSYKWLYAAAAILIVLSALFIVFEKKPVKEIVSVPKVEQPIKDSASQTAKLAEPVQQPQITVPIASVAVQKNRRKKTSSVPQDVISKDQVSNDLAVGAQKELLALVTEVY